MSGINEARCRWWAWGWCLGFTFQEQGTVCVEILRSDRERNFWPGGPVGPALGFFKAFRDERKHFSNHIAVPSS